MRHILWLGPGSDVGVVLNEHEGLQVEVYRDKTIIRRPNGDETHVILYKDTDGTT